MISLRIPAGPCKSILLTSRISFRGFLGLHNGGRTACVRVSSTSSKIGCDSGLNYQSKPFFAPRTPLPTTPPLNSLISFAWVIGAPIVFVNRIGVRSPPCSLTGLHSGLELWAYSNCSGLWFSTDPFYQKGSVNIRA